MKIEKEIRSKIERDFFFIEGTLDIDNQYFINEIDKGLKKEDNQSYKTNVIGGHTAWNYFFHDKPFLVQLATIVDYIDENHLSSNRFQLQDAWGIREGFGDYTKPHTHLPSFASATIYLTNHTQKLYFPQIKKEVIPQCGKFVLFSSFLTHYTQRNKQEEYKYALVFNLSHKGFDN
tara:strand:+ start:76 stop:603 length:528 start_codon:yes stop_codon:yes gene_type:complete